MLRTSMLSLGAASGLANGLSNAVCAQAFSPLVLDMFMAMGKPTCYIRARVVVKGVKDDEYTEVVRLLLAKPVKTMIGIVFHAVCLSNIIFTDKVCLDQIIE